MSKVKISNQIILLSLTAGLVAAEVNAGAAGLTSQQAVSTSEIPKTLADMEGLAEDSYDVALAKDYVKIKSNAIEMNSYWKEFRDKAIRDGVNTKNIAGMDTSVAKFLSTASYVRDNIVLARAANSVSSWMDKFYDVFKPTIPAPVLRLDYLGRELVLDGMSKNMSFAKKHLDVVVSTWVLLEPRVIKANGASEATRFNKAAESLRQTINAKNGAAVVEQANIVLELLDAIEKLPFAMQPE